MRCAVGTTLAFVLLLGQVAVVKSFRVFDDRKSDIAVEKAKQEFADSDQAEAKVGLVLRDRYVLSSFIETRGNYSAEMGADADSVPGISFPRITRRGLSQPKHLGTGSFGDVWAAYDRKLNKEVAVKIFYISKPRKAYATWGFAARDRRLAEELESNIKECSLIRDILSHRSMYPVGATRICACFDEHISDVRQQKDRVVFLVQEMCGQSLRSSYLDYHAKRRTKDIDLAKSMIMQMLQGIAYLNMFNPPLIHHDLKPANVVMNKGEVKIIDWGGLIFAKSSTQYEPAVSTPLYTPPEADRGPSFAWGPRYGDAWPYDVYAVGLMFMEFVCPQLDMNTWYRARPLNSYIVKNLVRRACPGSDSQIGQELQLIGHMIDPSPKKRVSPEDALESSVFKQVEEKQANDMPADFLAENINFKIGATVQYWSKSLRRWADVTITGINHQKKCFQLTENMKVIFDCCPLARMRENPNNAAVNEALHVPVPQVPADDDDPTADLLQGNQVMWPMHNNNGKAGKGADRVYIELTTIRQTTTPAGTLKLQTEFVCLSPANCRDPVVTLSCPGTEVVRFKVVRVAKVNAKAKSVIMGYDIPHGEMSRVGKRCQADATASVTTDGSTFTTQKAAPKMISTYFIT